MKAICTILLAAAAFSVSAAEKSKDEPVTLRIDTERAPRAAFPCGVPCVGYVADPVPGDETAVLAYRRAGAWTFRTRKCDEDTLAFCVKYGLRVFVILDGERKEMGQTLTRLSKSPNKKALAGIQLGDDPTGGADPTLWRSIAVMVVKKLPGVPVAVPVKDEKSPLFVSMRGYYRAVTHLMVDLRDTPAPYARIRRLADRLRDSAEPDKAMAKLRLWAVAPGRLAGTPDDKVSAPPAIAWQMHWIMTAFAEDLTAGVFVDRAPRGDDFGLAMRHFWAATCVTRSLVCHGEGATSSKFAPKPVRQEEWDLSLEDESLDKLELNDVHAAGPEPVACGKVAQGKAGDIEYVVFLGELINEEEGRRVTVFLVNTTGARKTVKVDINRNSGSATSGFRRRLVPDEKTGAMRNSTRERRGNPITETVEPGEVTFFDFRIF